jgi:hypothetical protein
MMISAHWLLRKERMKNEILTKTNEIERRLLDTLLDGDDPILDPLRIHCLIHQITRP